MANDDGVLLEEISSQLSAVAEGVIAVNDKVDRLEKTLNVVKSDVELIKHELRQKVDLADFQALEKRVSTLEARPV